MSDEGDFDLEAAGLRADSADIGLSVEALAAKLEQALPTATKVQRRARKLLSKERHVHELEVRIAATRFTLVVRDGRPEGFREREVGGISIKREPLELTAWLSALTAELRAEAHRSAQARAALESLLA